MTSKVNDKSPAMAAMEADWMMIEALMGGTRAMRRAGQKLLPRFAKEDKEAYEARLAVATLFPAYRRTISVMVGKPFSKPLTLGADVPPEIAGKPATSTTPAVPGWADDIDREGVNLHAFAAEMFGEALAYGLAGILVEAPRAPETATGEITRAVEQAAGMRPYWVRVKHGQILGWREESRNGRRVLTQLRLKETNVEPDGEFGEKTVERVRVLTPGAWAIYEKRASANVAEEWALVEQGVSGLDEIPFVPLYGWREGFMRGSPPLLDLAFNNVKHWQSQSDQDNILHVARVPILTVIGGDKNTSLTVGAGSAINVPQGGDVKFTEHSGAGIGAGLASLTALEAQMIQAGAELLTKQPGDRSATEAANDADANKSDLQRIVETFEDSLDHALHFTAMFAGLPEGGHVSLFKDFGVSIDAAASAQVLQAMRLAGDLSYETYFAEMQRRGYIAPDVDSEDERERIEAEGAALGTMGDPAADPMGGVAA